MASLSTGPLLAVVLGAAAVGGLVYTAVKPVTPPANKPTATPPATRGALALVGQGLVLGLVQKLTADLNANTLDATDGNTLAGLNAAALASLPAATENALYNAIKAFAANPFNLAASPYSAAILQVGAAITQDVALRTGTTGVGSPYRTDVNV